MSGDDGAAVPVDRRRGDASARSPMETLSQLPALIVLERFPVPVLAIGDDGAILFANSAFAEMLGHPAVEVMALHYAQIFQIGSTGESAVTELRSQANLLVELRHADGSTVRAKMSNSVLLRGDDDVVLAVFQDLTEQLWLDEV